MTGSAFQQVAGAARTDGWLDDAAEVWTYASGSGGGVATFTVPGDQTAKYTVGTRIKLTQTTVKYFVVSADPTYNSGTGLTTVTIMSGSDYTLANAAISANYHSYEVNPQGYPGWFIFAPSLTGFSGTPTVQAARFSVLGRTATIVLKATGTSNSTSTGFTAPIATALAFENDMIVACTNNGTSQTGLGDAYLNGVGSVWAVFRDFTGLGWTASGTKAFRLYGSYEI